MNLCYRGTTYQPQKTQVETVALPYIVRFLGRAYLRRRPQKSYKSQIDLKKNVSQCFQLQNIPALKYRGVVYDK